MDRFIPARSAMDLDVANFNLLKENGGQANLLETASPSKVPCPCTKPNRPVRHKLNLASHSLNTQAEYKKRLAEGLGTETAPRILAFKNKVH